MGQMPPLPPLNEALAAQLCVVALYLLLARSQVLLNFLCFSLTREESLGMMLAHDDVHFSGFSVGLWYR